MSDAHTLLKSSSGLIAKAVVGVIVILALVYVMSKSFFYAEPGYIYHVRTVTGSEAVVTEVGYKFYPFGRYNSWKRAMTVQASSGSSVNAIRAEKDSDNESASLPPLSIMFLDQVDAHAEATVRFSIPSDEVSFLKLAHEYRSPENLLRTALLPAFKETLQANASLMAAEEYYAGGRTEFNSEFENQMSNGIFLVKREEVSVRSTRSASGSANAALGTEQEQYGEDSKTVFLVNKVIGPDGQPRRKSQRFTDFGITVVSALVTDMKPNQKFIERMQLKQKASADRAIAREQRVQEEEQRLLAIARGEREVAERQAKAKVEQIQKTTEAETDKQLAITGAEKLKAEAAISKETAEINLEKARVEAETRRTLADAEAYQKEVILQADNALAQKLEAEVQIQRLWADAFAKRNVPTNVFGGGNGGAPVGNDAETKAFMQMLTLDAAKRLNYDREVTK
ncbi:SPFH domain-containing protein [Neptunomonas phycophila]|jgi:regulator of protease activity HflC (stomatin/prohibitin superfamily)|uniref:SPFH domain-containing protein n=1 Tax=Neptunomonas phycophila TaxID=1572645 RepID=A0AAW7XEV9_9GAMM|nr:SPFH domain-containing protein [Neptunomonas phycophila]MDO6452759.1 SPFH domain-containing protein [Neptunomonas phycophila]MDO6467585.1 SPFH domain-containing protein [Neptunomonas phycophila]MDP2521603.1 SPFH domain-containing protein [Neptunomonas phycophila]